MSNPPPLICIGDPNGIGPEIAVRAAAEMQKRQGVGPVIVGDRFVVDYYASRLGMDVVAVEDRGASTSGALRLLTVNALAEDDFIPGHVSPSAGRATVEYIRAAVAAVESGLTSAIVAAPHSETAINSAGIPFAGYPALLSELGGDGDPVFLMLVHDTVRISHVTLHCSVRDALDQLNTGLVEQAIVATGNALRRMGVGSPRVGVFGINPHAGEGGLFGVEDERVVAPAVAAALRHGLDVTGPTGCDVLLADRSRFDGFVAMFHDQGHAPMKLLAGRNASALSIGSRLTFASVGHGAAFDIAGQHAADHRPLIRALQLVGSMSTGPAKEDPR